MFRLAAFSVARATLGTVIVLSLLGIGSCDKGPEWKKAEFSRKDFSGSVSDVQLPQSLWKKMEKLLHDADPKNKVEADAEPEAKKAKDSSESAADHSASGDTAPGDAASNDAGPNDAGPNDAGPNDSSGSALPTEFSPLKVFLIEKNRGILKRINLELSFGAGGGEIDLSQLVAPLNGSFYLVAEFLTEAKVTARKVFYLSNAIARRLDGETVGAGCNAYFDVTSAFEKAQTGTGLLINTSGNRHVSALAGTFFFAAVVDERLHLASLTIRDSGQRSLQCRR